MGRRMRPLAPTADRGWVKELWAAALPPAWPPLPAGIAMLRDGLVAEAGADPIGLAAVDMAGSIPLVLVHPAHQRRGIGTGLLAAALDKLRAAGATEVTAASGGDGYIWPGVPLDLAAGVRFFASRGWRRGHDTLDLVADLAQYRPPAAAGPRAASAGISLAPTTGADAAGVLAFEAATFPSWVRWFGAGTATSSSRGTARGASPGPCSSRDPARIRCSRRCSARRPGSSDASAWRRTGRDAGSARRWSPAPRSSSARPAPAPATSAGPPASPSTAGPATGRGGGTRCSLTRPAAGREADVGPHGSLASRTCRIPRSARPREMRAIRPA